MILDHFIDLLNKIENEPSTNKKIELIKPHITNPFLLSLLTMPAINVGNQTILKTLAAHTGHNIVDIKAEYILDGRISDVVEKMLFNTKTTTLSNFFKMKEEKKEDVNIIQIYSLLKELASVSGFSKQSAILHELFHMNTSAQVINIITGDRAIGIKKNNIFKALPGNTNDIAKAYALCNNWFLLCSSLDDLSEIKATMFMPISSQLCQSCSIDTIKIDKPIALEDKHDGVRIQVHTESDRIEIYTRGLENKTLSMPDFVESNNQWLTLNNSMTGIFDMELLPHTVENGQFIRLEQESVITRLGKHNIHQKMKEVQLDARIFDVMMLNGEILIDKPYTERRKILENFKYGHNIKLAEMVIVNSIEEFKDRFFKVTKEREGVVKKPLKSKYVPGNRGLWEKIKPLLPTFDLIITKAFYGKNKNAGLYSSFELSAMRNDGDLRAIGKVGIGFSDIEMERLTDDINSQKIGRTTEYVELLNPSIILEIACEKVNLIRGHVSMDFARKISIRTDKKEITTTDEMKRFVRKG